jgi:hypothetical protein
MALVKTLSVKQPYASFLCYGIKTVENRTWKTDYRGRLLIHASGDNMSFFNTDSLPQSFLNTWYDYIEKDEWNCPKDAPEAVKNAYWMSKDIWKHYGIAQDDMRNMDGWIKSAVKEHGCFFKSMAIIGEVTLTDVIQDSKNEFAFPGQYHWIVEKPILYDKPIINVAGRLRLWNFNID